MAAPFLSLDSDSDAADDEYVPDADHDNVMHLDDDAAASVEVDGSARKGEGASGLIYCNLTLEQLEALHDESPKAPAPTPSNQLPGPLPFEANENTLSLVCFVCDQRFSTQQQLTDHRMDHPSIFSSQRAYINPTKMHSVEWARHVPTEAVLNDTLHEALAWMRPHRPGFRSFRRAANTTS